MEKKALIFVFLIFFSTIVFSNTITDYNVPTQINAGLNLTVYGKYFDGNGSEGVLCSFFIFKNDGTVLERLSDEYTFTDGSFYTERKIDEPPYFRDDNYTIETICNTATASAVFSVTQPLTLAHPIQKDISYIFSSGNTDSVLFLGTLIMFAIAIIVVIAFFIKRGKKLAS